MRFNSESGSTNPTNASRAIATIAMKGAGFNIVDSTNPPKTPLTAPITLKASTRSASHPTGPPASSSFLATRSRVSSGVTRLATRPAPATTGTSTRWPKFFDSSCSRRLMDSDELLT